MKLEGHVALITGGATGIGLALARALLERKNTVVVVGRRAARLEQAKAENPGLHVIECDVADCAKASAMLERVLREHGGLSLLVNNAAVQRRMNLLEALPAQVDEETATNFLAPVKLTMAALPALLREPEAAVVNVTSGVAYAPMGGMPLYSATKAALHSFSQTLRYQLMATSVRVFELLPPLTDTDANADKPGKKWATADVAAAALRGIEKNRPEIAIGESSDLRLGMRLMPGLVGKRVLSFEG